MSVAPHLPKPKKPKQPLAPVARVDTPVYEVELAATDIKSFRESRADANVTVISVGDHAKVTLPGRKTRGGTVSQNEYWGLRSLTFRIKKNRKGHYTLLNIDAPPAAIKELERTMSINEDIIRYLTERVDKLQEDPSATMHQARLVEATEPRRAHKTTPQIKASAFQPSARARALLRGAEAIAADLKAAGGTFDLKAVCSLTHLTRQAIHKKVIDGRLLAVPGPSKRNVYPVAQFNDDGGAVEGLKEVREALGSTSPWMLLNFLVNPEARLDNRKPIDLLRAGKLEAVVEAARHLGIQGA